MFLCKTRPFQRVLEIADRVGVHEVFGCVGNDMWVILLRPRLVNLLNSIPSFQTLGKSGHARLTQGRFRGGGSAFLSQIRKERLVPSTQAARLRPHQRE